MRIRRAKQEDLTRHVILRQELWPKDDLEELLKEAHDILKQGDDYPVFFAIDQHGDVCGFIELTTRHEAPGCKTNEIAYVEGWYVKEDARNKGFGRLLLQAGEEWAKNKGLTEMASDTTKDYPVSPAVHQSLGFTETSKPLHYMKQL